MCLLVNRVKLRLWYIYKILNYTLICIDPDPFYQYTYI